MHENIQVGMDMESFYLQFLTDKRRIGEELLTNCPFHDDKTASFSANLKTGLWRCHTVDCPQHKGGNAITFYAALKKISTDKAAMEVKAKFYKGDKIENKADGKLAAALEQVRVQHLRLMRNNEALSFLRTKCGYDDKLLKDYQIGYDGDRYWIPIMENGLLVNVRQYKPNDTIKMKGLPGHNVMRLWPSQHLAGDTVYIFEGEKDCLLGIKLGLPAITVTAGSGSFKPEWLPLFKNKNVVVCYDVDDAGKKGAAVVAEYLAGVTQSLKIIDLPIPEIDKGDFTDYIMEADFEIKDFKKLVEDTKPFKGISDAKAKIGDEVHFVELAEASQKEFFFKRVRIEAIIVGKDLAPYLVPKKMHVTCLMGKKTCPYCGIGLKGGDFEVEFTEESGDVLRLINCTDMQQERAIREKLDVYGNCRQYKYEVTEAQNIEEIKLTPEIKYSTDIKEYVIRVAYYLGHGIKANQSYLLTGITMPHPQTQYATHVIYNVKESSISIEKFKLTEEIIKQLVVFQCQ